jgi:uncharacterized membrane protein
MWLIIALVAAAVTTALYYISLKRYRLGTLSLMFWGLTFMILIDHVLGYEGGPFFEMQTDGLIGSGIVLGLLMLIPVIAIWLAIMVFNRPKKEIETKG